MIKTFTYQDQQFLPVSSELLFDFFSKPDNLSKITPTSSGFRVVESSKSQIDQGVVIKYRLKIMGIPVYWVARIEEWLPNLYFTDVQVKGPFAYYKHRHILEKAEGGTIIRDELEYRLPLGFIGALFGNFFVRQELKRTFAFRKQKMEELFN